MSIFNDSSGAVIIDKKELYKLMIIFLWQAEEISEGKAAETLGWERTEVRALRDEFVNEALAKFGEKHPSQVGAFVQSSTTSNPKTESNAVDFLEWCENRHNAHLGNSLLDEKGLCEQIKKDMHNFLLLEEKINVPEQCLFCEVIDEKPFMSTFSRKGAVVGVSYLSENGLIKIYSVIHLEERELENGKISLQPAVNREQFNLLLFSHHHEGERLRHPDSSFTTALGSAILKYGPPVANEGELFKNKYSKLLELVNTGRAVLPEAECIVFGEQLAAELFGENLSASVMFGLNCAISKTLKGCWLTVTYYHDLTPYVRTPEPEVEGVISIYPDEFLPVPKGATLLARVGEKGVFTDGVQIIPEGIDCKAFCQGEL